MGVGDRRKSRKCEFVFRKVASAGKIVSMCE